MNPTVELWWAVGGGVVVLGGVIWLMALLVSGARVDARMKAYREIADKSDEWRTEARAKRKIYENN